MRHALVRRASAAALLGSCGRGGARAGPVAARSRQSCPPRSRAFRPAPVGRPRRLGRGRSSSSPCVPSTACCASWSWRAVSSSRGRSPSCRTATCSSPSGRAVAVDPRRRARSRTRCEACPRCARGACRGSWTSCCTRASRRTALSISRITAPAGEDAGETVLARGRWDGDALVDVRDIFETGTTGPRARASASRRTACCT